jgi:hypothetical protein
VVSLGAERFVCIAGNATTAVATTASLCGKDSEFEQVLQNRALILVIGPITVLN